jgi:hypothetical protein
MNFKHENQMRRQASHQPLPDFWRNQNSKGGGGGEEEVCQTLIQKLQIFKKLLLWYHQ